MMRETIMMIAAYVLYLLAFILIPVRRTKVNKYAGKMLMQFTSTEKQKSTFVKDVVIIVFCAILIFLVSRIRFQIFAAVVLNLCAVLGNFITVKEISLTNLCGIYENAIVQSGYIILFDQIKELPQSKMLKDENSKYSPETLVIKDIKNREYQLIFSSESECNVAKKELKKILHK